jgi:hypothetical protein
MPTNPQLAGIRGKPCILKMSIQSLGAGCRCRGREELDDAGQRIYDNLADPKGGTCEPKPTGACIDLSHGCNIRFNR